MVDHEWDSDEWRKLRNKKLLEWFLGNQDAVDCLVDISTVSETWDDLIDKDKNTTDHDINSAFTILLVKLPLNRFYITYRHYLEPLIITGINAWLDSERLIKEESEKDRMLAFYIRNYCAEIAQAIAFCIGGFEYMRNISLDIRQFLNHETYSEWENRHGK